VHPPQVIKSERQEGRASVTHAGVIGQVWCGGHGRQALLSRLLPGVEIQAVDGDEIFTSDPADLRALAQAAGAHVDLVPV